MRIATKKSCLRQEHSWFLATASSCALAILAMSFVALSFITIGSNKAFADVSADTVVNLDVDPIINISTPTTATLNCASANQLCTTSSTINVSTNNVTGYTLQMNATSGSPTDLTNSATSPASTIPTLAQSYSSANFPVNYWGYTGGTDKSSETGGYDCASNYCPILAYNSGGNYAPNHIIKETSAPATSSALTITFGSKVSNTKPSGTYTTSVTFTAVANYVPGPDPCLSAYTLYEKVACQSKGTQTLADMQAVITKPTSNDPATDTSNSGVYKYDATTFGTASDAANTHDIYYYRGILDSDLTDASTTTAGYVGSSGDGAYYPNYVVLSSASDKSNLATSDTCWRIVRTTGSGGVKMIYNGKWTGSTCANAGADANAVSDVYFNRRSSSSTNNYDTTGRIIYAGYNFSSTASHQTDTSSVANSTLFVNNTASNLRTQLESWYASNMTSYTSKLETNAGWCNDRTTYDSSYTSTSSNVPYKTSSATVNFGAYKRNIRSGASEKLSLTCTNTADRLTTSNGMTYPAAPLTADEAALAGSGYSGRTSASTYSSNYHYNSYLRSGGGFWLLSPYYRGSSGYVRGFYLSSSGYLYFIDVSKTNGVRPSISLTSGTAATSGTGTATDPWIVEP